MLNVNVGVDTSNCTTSDQSSLTSSRKLSIISFSDEYYITGLLYWNSILFWCSTICVSFPTQRECNIRRHPDSCFQCHFTPNNHKGFLVTRCQCPAENRSAHHSSYYSLSPGTVWCYTILPDRKRREKEWERGEREKEIQQQDTGR